MGSVSEELTSSSWHQTSICGMQCVLEGALNVIKTVVQEVQRQESLSSSVP